MNPIEREQLIDEYHESLRLVRHAHTLAKVRRDDQRDENAAIDCQHLSSMERDLMWAIQYLETGYPPDYHRAVYRNTVPVDPHILKQMRRIRRLNSPTGWDWVTPNPDLAELLCILTPREREAFVMVRGRGISFRQAAEYMQVRSSGTVSNMVRRAERKLRRAVIGYKSQSFPNQLSHTCHKISERVTFANSPRRPPEGEGRG